MNVIKIKKHIEDIRDCSLRQTEIYRLLGKHMFSEAIEKDLRKEADEYQKIIDRKESIIKKEITE